MGKGAEHGVLIKNGDALEDAQQVDMVLLDKTGTITEGKPAVTDVLPLGAQSEQDLLALAGAAEKGSEHPLGKAILRAAEAKGLSLPEVGGFKALPGMGVVVDYNGKLLRIGNQKMIEEYLSLGEDALKLGQDLANDGKTPMFVALEEALLGIIAVADTVKPDSKEAINQLHKMGVQVAMVTGDNRRTAEAIGRVMGLDQVFSEVLPDQKAGIVNQLKSEGRFVAMVGDGFRRSPRWQRRCGDCDWQWNRCVHCFGGYRADAYADGCARGNRSEQEDSAQHQAEPVLGFCLYVIGIPIAMGVFAPVWRSAAQPDDRRRGNEFELCFRGDECLRLRAIGL